MRPVGRPFRRRFRHALLTLFGASIAIWALLLATPGDPARRLLIAQGIPEPLPADVAAARAQLRLDDPLPVRYGRWVLDLVRGDLGTSWFSNQPVRDELAARAMPTLLLAVTALVIVAVMAVSAAFVSTRWRSRWPDHMIAGLAVLFSSVPSFLVAVILLHVVAVEWGIGRVISRGDPTLVWMPALALSLGIAATWARVLRAGMCEALDRPSIELARARGATEGRLVVRHAFPIALVPLLPFAAVTVGALVGGAAVVESVFSWPGLGRYLVDAVAARDIPVIQAYVMIGTVVFVVSAFCADALAWRLDTRLRDG